MDIIVMVLQIVVAAGLLNVWLIRPFQKTPYRGGSAITLKDEFAVYGLPVWFFYLVGVLKVAAAFLLILGLWVPQVVFPAALTLAILMIGAILMHFKVSDPIKKSLPALLMLAMSLIICWYSV